MRAARTVGRASTIKHVGVYHIRATGSTGREPFASSQATPLGFVWQLLTQLPAGGARQRGELPQLTPAHTHELVLDGLLVATKFLSDIREFRTVIDDDVVNAGGRDVVLFACECGQVACSSVLVDVEVVNDMVRFTNFRDSQAPARSKRAIRSAGLAVEFDRHAYVAQIQALRQAASQP